MRGVSLLVGVMFAQAVFAEETPPPKPQTYLYEWYSPYTGVKIWAGEPPESWGKPPKVVCIWQESNSLGCYDYSLPETRQFLQNKAAIQKQQTADWEAYKAKEATMKAEKEHKELLASESGEMRDVLSKSKSREIQRIGMGTAQTVADRIIEIAELSPRIQKYLSSGLLSAASVAISKITVASAGVINPKTNIEKLLNSSEPTDKALGERAQAAVGEMGVSMFTGNDSDVTKGIAYYVAQYVSALELAKKSQPPKTP